MKKLVDGVRRFRHDVFRLKRALFARLAGGQHPLAMFITCADSRIDPCLLTQTEPGELFILRNAGNIVPPYGVLQGGEAGTIEFAIRGLQIRDIIVCGHSQCGAMEGLLHLEKTEALPALKSWLSHAEPTQRAVRSKFAATANNEQELLERVIEQNVLAQLENLKTHPAVAEALARNELTLHGWVYQLETGTVLGWQQNSQQFASLDGTDSRNVEA